MRMRSRICLEKRTHIDIGRRAKRVAIVRMIIVEEYGGSEGGIAIGRAGEPSPWSRRIDLKKNTDDLIDLNLFE